MVSIPSNKIRSGRRALSLPESLISLAITTTLLVAVAAAFTASSNAIDNNDEFFRCSQAARVTMNQMLGEIRNAAFVDFKDYTNAIEVDRIAPLNGQSGYYSATTNSGGSLESKRLFSYDSAGQRITLQIFYQDGTNSPVYELATNVTSCRFGVGINYPGDYVQDYNQNNQMPKYVPIQITVTNGPNAVVLNGSAASRSAMKY